jgi:hypothetical protein
MAVVSEDRKLRAHEKFLLDGITRQAGTLEKACTEGTMNSIEAGATEQRIDLEVGEKCTISICDDGEGIVSRDDVLNHFEMFGTPHEEHENTRWKQFRMGRGQIFSFGKNYWRTDQWKMIVDINNWKLNYKLEGKHPVLNGCDILVELYDNPIDGYTYRTIADFKAALRKQVRFVEIPVYFNGEEISGEPQRDSSGEIIPDAPFLRPSQIKWDYEDENAYYMFNIGSCFSVYNLGVWVNDKDEYKAGMCGIAVSKKQLKVNFARNDVMSTCKIWPEIDKVIKKNRINKVRRTRRTLNSAEKFATLQDLRSGDQEYKAVKNLRLLTTTQGKHVSLEDMRKMKQPWTFAEHGDRLCDKMMERGQAVCLDRGIWDRMNYQEENCHFFRWLTTTPVMENSGYCGSESWQYRENRKKWEKMAKLYRPYDELSDGISDDYEVISDKKLTVAERRILAVLNQYYCWKERTILIGASDRALAWTDGRTYICVERLWLKNTYLQHGHGANKLMTLLAHEVAHDEDTRGSHVHGPEFYEANVGVLEGNDSPTAMIPRFIDQMEKSKIEEKKAAVAQRKARADAKISKKLAAKV